MNDDALTAWLDSGAPVALSSEAAAARRRSDFVRRFLAALRPEDDLGPTCELHEAAVTENVKAVHNDLRVHGIDEYDEVWRLMDAPTRSAIKRYVAA